MKPYLFAIGLLLFIITILFLLLMPPADAQLQPTNYQPSTTSLKVVPQSEATGRPMTAQEIQPAANIRPGMGL